MPIEAQGAQSLHEWTQERNSNIYVVPIKATLPKKERLRSVTPWLQDPDQVVLFHPRTIQIEHQPFEIDIGGKVPITTLAERTLRSELLDFPTTHDDVCDSFVQGLRFIRQHVLELDDGDNDEDADREAETQVMITVRSG